MPASLTTKKHRSSMRRTASSTEGTAYARSTGLPSSLGKSTADLKCKVPDSVKDDFLRLARACDMSESELLREVVLLRLYGRDFIERMQLKRIAMVAGMGPDEA